ncbi:MAG: hypothetical protein GXO94_06975 [Nitrospirae bacterium]|nr:hypothetical protein [Nitrospirota bacterium]
MASFFSDTAAGPVPKLGRNEPCWCGSGKKYKKCHLEEDDRKRSKYGTAACKTS